MPVVDMHAHVVPERFKEAIRGGHRWHGLDLRAGGVMHPALGNSLNQRLEQMAAWGVDLQLITPSVGFYQYANDPAVTDAIARDCNDEIAEMTAAHPRSFAGLGTLPMQDIPLAVAELERVMTDLGLRGVMVSDHVKGQTYDEERFDPFFEAAESLDALIFFHQGGDTVVSQRIARYDLGNAVGNMTERILVFAALVFGGVMDRYPKLRALLGHGGGYTTFGAARLDKVAGALEGGGPGKELQPPFGWKPDATFRLTRAPSSYLRRFLYDTCVYDGAVVRFLIDRVGVDRVVLGTDYPAPMSQVDPVRWLEGLRDLSAHEREAITTLNPSRELGMAGTF